jgi:actin-related protein
MSEEISTKQINITGINNRYQIKKLVAPHDPKKKRAITNKWNLQKEYYQVDYQLKFLNEIVAGDLERSEIHNLIIFQFDFYFQYLHILK